MRMTKRIWMTGCMALVLLAAGRPASARDDQDDTEQRSQRTRITLTSKYDLDETVRQVERSARRNGLPVVARAEPASADATATGSDSVRVLVLGDQDGRTPIMQADTGMHPELPWHVLIRQRADGQTEVSLPAPGALTALPDGVAQATLEKVSSLPDVLKSVIT